MSYRPIIFVALTAAIGFLLAPSSALAEVHNAPSSAKTVAVVKRTQHSGQQVALTFDDGPSEQWTPQVLNLLHERGIKATFCVVGSQVNRFPQLVRQIVDEGHALCNHSMRHASLQNWTSARIKADIQATNRAIHAAAPDAAIPYFRAPYGQWGTSARIAASLGMTPLGWSVDSRDWSRPGTNKIIQTVHAQLRPTGVVLMHDAGDHVSQTLAALRSLIPQLESQGWTFDLPLAA